MNTKPLVRCLPSCILIVVSFFSLNIHSQTISTIAGGTIGDGKPANTIGLPQLLNMASDTAGNLYVFDPSNKRIRKIDATNGVITTVAGGGNEFIYDSPAPALNVSLPNIISDLAVDRKGNVYFSYQREIAKLDITTGDVVKIAGTGQGYGGDNGPAINAGFSGIASIAVDTADNIFIADATRIRKITATTGVVTTIAGQDSTGNEGDNGPAINARFIFPNQIRTDKDGNLYIADQFAHVLRKITMSTGIITKIAGQYGQSGFAGDGGPATSAKFENLVSFTIGQHDDIHILDVSLGASRIRTIIPGTGIIITTAGPGIDGISGDDGPATDARLMNPIGIVADGKGALFFIDNGFYNIRKIILGTGIISRAYGNNSAGYSGIGGPAKDAQIYETAKIAVDPANNIYLSDRGDNKVYKIDAITKTISTVAGTGVFGPYQGDGVQALAANIGHPSALATDTAGNLYIVEEPQYIRKVNAVTGVVTTVAGIGWNGLSGDGGPATAAGINTNSIYVDVHGDIYLANLSNIRKIDAATGIINSIAGDGSYNYTGDGGPASSAGLMVTALTLDKKGNIYFADQVHHVVRRIDATTKIITTVAGDGTQGYSGDDGLAVAAQLNKPMAVATDSAGNVYVTDNGNHCVRKIDIATGIITTIAGGGVPAYNGDDIPANTAALSNPFDIVFDTLGRLVIADYDNVRIRMITFPVVETYKAYLSGSIFYDDNSDGVKDPGEAFADGITVSISKPGLDIRTVTKNGLFKIQADTGTYTSKIMDQVYYTSVPGSVVTIFTTGVNTDSISFALQAIPGKTDLQLNLIPTSAVRPGFKVNYKLEYNNDGTAKADNAKLILVKSSKLTIDNTVPAYTSISGDTLVWNLNTIQPKTGASITITGTLAAPPIANANDSLFISAIISHDKVDVNPKDDTVRLKQRVTGAIDPNDKTEIHGGIVSPAQIAAGEYLNYIIRFQNTGNDTAFTVLIRDTLDTKFDFSTLQVISASHDYQLSITDSNKLAWQFDNILLADSNVNEAASHGYIAFRIKPKATTVLGDMFENSSAIYFDFNPPVYTNKTTTVVKNLPPAPVKPLIDLKGGKFCIVAGEQKLKLLNRNPGYTARAFVGTKLIAIGADSILSILPTQYSKGNYTVRVEYINESGEAAGTSSITIEEAADPVVTVATNKTSITTDAEVAIITASNNKGGGTAPLYSFAKDRNFTNIIKAESATATANITAADLANGDNKIYVRMKTSESCYTKQYALDSVTITKNLTTTGVIDIDNPGITISGYPNPFTTGITVNGLQSHKKYQLLVYDSRGIELNSYTVNNRTVHHINTSSWASGVYLIKILDVKKGRVIGTLKAIK